MRSKLPELPDAKRDRFIAEYSLTLYDANLLTSSKVMAEYFESYMKEEPHRRSPKKSAKMVANWILGEFSHLLNATHTEINESRVSPGQLCQLLGLIQTGNISGTSAKLVFEEMFNTGKDADEIIQERGLTQISDTKAIETEVIKVINSNAQAVADYQVGKEQALKFLVGQVMKVTRGRANPKLVNELLKKRVGEG